MPTLDTLVKYSLFSCKMTEVCICWMIDWLRSLHLIMKSLDIRLKVGELDGVDILLRALSVSRNQLYGTWPEIELWRLGIQTQRRCFWRWDRDGGELFQCYLLPVERTRKQAAILGIRRYRVDGDYAQVSGPLIPLQQHSYSSSWFTGKRPWLVSELSRCWIMLWVEKKVAETDAYVLSMPLVSKLYFLSLWVKATRN